MTTHLFCAWMLLNIYSCVHFLSFDVFHSWSTHLHRLTNKLLLIMFGLVEISLLPCKILLQIHIMNTCFWFFFNRFFKIVLLDSLFSITQHNILLQPTGFSLVGVVMFTHSSVVTTPSREVILSNNNTFFFSEPTWWPWPWVDYWLQ